MGMCLPLSGVFNRPTTLSARALSYDSPALPTDRSMPASGSCRRVMTVVAASLKTCLSRALRLRVRPRVCRMSRRCLWPPR